MNIFPYLFFKGNCAEAFAHYGKVFGVEPTFSSTFSEGPDDWPVFKDDASRIMHISLPFGSGMLMGSDVPSNVEEGTIIGTNVNVNVLVDSRESADEVFAGLSDGGEVRMAMQDTFWNSYFGVVKDRFDIIWMISFDNGSAH